MALTIDKIKDKRTELESKILDLVRKFEKDTDTYVSYMDFERKISKGGKSTSAVECVPEPERDGPIANVDVSLRFDL